MSRDVKDHRAERTCRAALQDGEELTHLGMLYCVARNHVPHIGEDGTEVSSSLISRQCGGKRAPVLLFSGYDLDAHLNTETSRVLVEGIRARC